FFFFQAEDGIRDRNVTGVQTCALPICLRDNQRSPEPGVLTPLATWTLLSCLFRLFLRSRSIWSKGSLWGGFWRFRQYDGTFVRNDKSFVFSRVLHKGLIIFFALEFLPIASQLQ